MATTIGVVADTHVPDRLAEIPPRALRLLAEQGVQTILHAGDICHPSAIGQLEGVATVVAVRGNRDLLRPANWALPACRTIQVEEIALGLTHGHGSGREYVASKLWRPRREPFRTRLVRLLGRFDAPVQAVVYGHTHVPRIDWIDGVLFFNPGSPAPEYFTDLGPTVGLLRIHEGLVEPHFLPVG